MAETMPIERLRSPFGTLGLLWVPFAFPLGPLWVAIEVRRTKMKMVLVAMMMRMKMFMGPAIVRSLLGAVW